MNPLRSFVVALAFLTRLPTFAARPIETAELARAMPFYPWVGALSGSLSGGLVLALPGLSEPEIVAAGARRISVGGGLTWVAVSAMAAAAEEIRDGGDLSSLAARVPLGEWFSR